MPRGRAVSNSERQACGLTSLPGSLPVGGDRLLEVLVLLTGNEADPLQGRQVLLGLGKVIDHQISLPGILVGAPVPGAFLSRPADYRSAPGQDTGARASSH